MTNRIAVFIVSTVSLLAVSLFPLAVFAQTDDAAIENELKEDIVTATRREKDIQDVPNAIKSITARQKEDAGIRRV